MQEIGKRALSENDKRQGELQSEVARLKEDEGQIRAQQLQTAKIIQASEAQLSAIEQRRGELEAQEQLIRGSLATKQGSLSGLLAAMQRMGRNPPPVMITRREDALDMVRSAKLIAASAPELAAQANALADQLTDLSRIMASIKSEEDKLRAETRSLSEAQTRLAALAELRKQTLSDRNREVADLKRATNEIRREVADLGEFIAKTDREVAERTRLGQYEKELAAEQARKAAQPPPVVPPQVTPPLAAEPAPKQVATVEIRPPEKTVVAAAPAPVGPKAVAAAPAPKPDLKPSITLAPNDRMAMAAPGRIQPSMPFIEAKGRLPMPAQGRRVVNYGEKTQRGAFQGIAIETRFGAQVTSPTDGWVVYAGEFRSYGQILIINAGGGYHILLANMSQIDAAQGQFVLAGEPVGTMAPAPKGAQAPARGQPQEGAPILYIEFKKDQKSIDPDPWWAEPPKKNAGLITPIVISPQFSLG